MRHLRRRVIDCELLLCLCTPLKSCLLARRLSHLRPLSAHSLVFDPFNHAPFLRASTPTCVLPLLPACLHSYLGASTPSCVLPLLPACLHSYLHASTPTCVLPLRPACLHSYLGASTPSCILPLLPACFYFLPACYQSYLRASTPWGGFRHPSSGCTCSKRQPVGAFSSATPSSALSEADGALAESH